MCDTYLSARELLPSQRSYGLKQLARTHLSASKPEVEQAHLLAMFDDTASLLQLVKCTENNAFLSLQLMLKLMASRHQDHSRRPIAIFLTGSPIDKTTNESSGQLVEQIAPGQAR